MRLRSFILIFVILTAINCGKPDNSSDTKPIEIASTPVSESDINTKLPEISKDTLITIERGECFGRCPQYKLTISGDGKVSFDGKENTKVKGKASAELTTEEVAQLLLEFEKIGFFDLKDSYEKNNCPNASTDQPTVIFKVKTNGKEKTVSHYTGCVEGSEEPFKPYPPGLLSLGNTIHSIAESFEFIGPE